MDIRAVFPLTGASEVLKEVSLSATVGEVKAAACSVFGVAPGGAVLYVTSASSPSSEVAVDDATALQNTTFSSTGVVTLRQTACSAAVMCPATYTCGGTIYRAALTPCERHCILALDSGTIEVYDTETRRRSHSFQAGFGACRHIAPSPCGTALYAVSSDSRTLCHIDLANGALLNSVVMQAYSLSVSDSHIVTHDTRGVVVLNEALCHVDALPCEGISACACSPCGSFVLAAAGCTVRVWQPGTGEVLVVPVAGQFSAPRAGALAVSRCGAYFAVGGSSGGVGVYSVLGGAALCAVQTGEEGEGTGGRGSVLHTAFTPCSGYVVSIAHGALHQHDIATGALVRRIHDCCSTLAISKELPLVLFDSELDYKKLRVQWLHPQEQGVEEEDDDLGCTDSGGPGSTDVDGFNSNVFVETDPRRGQPPDEVTDGFSIN